LSFARTFLRQGPVAIAAASLLAASLPAQAAHWPFWGPVPTTALSDGHRFALCLELDVDLGLDGKEQTEGNITYRCESEEKVSRVCYEVDDDPWPTKWPTLTCNGADTRLTVTLVPAFDPASDLEKGAVISRRVDKAAAVYVVGQRFPGQRTEGERGSVCEVADGKLFVSRVGSSRRKDWCELRQRDGSVFRMPVKFRGKVR